jgi:hypothetical protein
VSGDRSALRYWTFHGCVTALVWLLLLGGAIWYAGREYGLW